MSEGDPDFEYRMKSEGTPLSRVYADHVSELQRQLAELRNERDALRAALKDLLACYDYQTESKYCVCGSNDLGGHSMACKVQMRAQDAAHVALRGQPKEGM